jgi:hypothetical protein
MKQSLNTYIRDELTKLPETGHQRVIQMPPGITPRRGQISVSQVRGDRQIQTTVLCGVLLACYKGRPFSGMPPVQTDDVTRGAVILSQRLATMIVSDKRVSELDDDVIMTMASEINALTDVLESIIA